MNTTSEISRVGGSRKVSSSGYIIYEITVKHVPLGRRKTFRGEFPLALERKAKALAEQWDTLWEKKQRSRLDSAPGATRLETDASETAARARRLNLDTSI